MAAQPKSKVRGKNGGARPGAGMPKGSTSEGSGRRKGIPNRRTLDLIERLESLGYDPITEVLAILKKKASKDPSKGLTLRDMCDTHMRMMKFLYPERKAIDAAPALMGDGNVVFVTQWGDADSDA